jgi:hypothetical protein
VGKEPWKVFIVLPLSTSRLIAPANPFEQKYQCAYRLKRGQGFWVKGVKIVDHQWNAERFQQLAVPNYSLC